MKGRVVNLRSGLERRKIRARTAIRRTSQRPRLCVVRTLKHVYAQVIDDRTGMTLAAASTLSPEIREQVKRTWTKEAAQAVGRLIAQKSKEKGVAAVAFDRGGRKYHGRIKALADAARESGLSF
jgi:large subunit ribosomal protein L18